jgi:hypothetical protein
MNDEHHDHESVEVFLHRFRPAAPPQDFIQHLRALRPVNFTAAPPAAKPSAAAKPARLPAFMPHLTAAAAALVAGFITWHWMQPEAAPVTSSGENTRHLAEQAAPHTPQQRTQQLMGVRDIGITRDEFRRPVRLMQATWLDDDIYHPAAGEQPLREARVREEIVPVVLNDF